MQKQQEAGRKGRTWHQETYREVERIPTEVGVRPRAVQRVEPDSGCHTVAVLQPSGKELDPLFAVPGHDDVAVDMGETPQQG